jgi:hypothetical protein
MKTDQKKKKNTELEIVQMKNLFLIFFEFGPFWFIFPPFFVSYFEGFFEVLPRRKKKRESLLAK